MPKPHIFLRGALLCTTVFPTFAQAQLTVPMIAPPAVSAVKAPYSAPKDVIDRIKDEALNRSKVMDTIGYLTDTIGPRLTGSPALKRANEWTRDTMVSYGMKNPKLEAWGPFGRGWSLEDFSAEVTSPYTVPVIAVPKAWSSSTLGPISAEVVLLSAQSVEDLDKYKGQLRGKIVLISPPRELVPAVGSLTSRLSDEDLAKLAEPPAESGPRGPRQRPQVGAPATGAPATPGTPAAPTAPGTPAAGGVPNRAALIGSLAARRALALRRMAFLRDEGAAVVVDNSGQGSGGTLFVQSATVAQDVAALTPAAAGAPAAPSAQVPIPGAAAPVAGAVPPLSTAPVAPPRALLQAQDVAAEGRILPQMTMATEDYNRIARRLQRGEKLTLRVNIATKFYDADLNCYNTVVEIPGTDLKDEVVMLGGHLDSWHSSTGATDNAAGCGVAMEAVRIIQALGLKPRRTIRVALWTGEEQGLFGSTAYVTQHLAEQPRRRRGFGGGADEAEAAPALVKKAEYDKVSAYFNLDNGTGKIRGIYAQGNRAAAPIFAQWLLPFADLGAKTVTLQNTGSTDHVPFDAVGVPGFQFIQDDVEYFTRTHHSNQDNFDRIQADDLKQASAIMAAFVYQTAMMDEKLPRKPLR